MGRCSKLSCWVVLVVLGVVPLLSSCSGSLARVAPPDLAVVLGADFDDSLVGGSAVVDARGVTLSLGATATPFYWYPSIPAASETCAVLDGESAGFVVFEGSPPYVLQLGDTATMLRWSASRSCLVTVPFMDGLEELSFEQTLTWDETFFDLELPPLSASQQADEATPWPVGTIDGVDGLEPLVVSVEPTGLVIESSTGSPFATIPCAGTSPSQEEWRTASSGVTAVGSASAVWIAYTCEVEHAWENDSSTTVQGSFLLQAHQGDLIWVEGHVTTETTSNCGASCGGTEVKEQLEVESWRLPEGLLIKRDLSSDVVTTSFVPPSFDGDGSITEGPDSTISTVMSSATTWELLGSEGPPTKLAESTDESTMTD